jgi:hypothetical protein
VQGEVWATEVDQTGSEQGPQDGAKQEKATEETEAEEHRAKKGVLPSPLGGLVRKEREREIEGDN